MIKNRNLWCEGAKSTSPLLERGLFLPKIPTASLPTAAAAYKGMLTYNTTTNKLNFCTGSGWEAVTSS